MIIALTFLGAISFFASIMFVAKRQPRIILAVITGIVFVASTTLMTLNYSHHFGMKKVTTTHTTQIYSASNSVMPLAIYQPVGTSGQDNVYLYNSQKHQQTPNHTQANEYTYSRIRWTNNHKAQLITTETRWQYNNQLMHCLFAGSGMAGKLVKRVNTLKYPRSYVLITTKQAQQLAKAVQTPAGRQMAAEAKKTGQQFVASQVQASLQKNPHLTTDQVQAIANQAQIDYQSQLVKKLLKQLA